MQKQRYIVHILVWFGTFYASAQYLCTVREVVSGAAESWELFEEVELEQARRATFLQDVSVSDAVSMMAACVHVIKSGSLSETLESSLVVFLKNQNWSREQIDELAKKAYVFRAGLQQLLGEDNSEQKKLKLEEAWWHDMKPLIELFKKSYEKLAPEIRKALKEKVLTPEDLDGYRAERRIESIQAG